MRAQNARKPSGHRGPCHGLWHRLTALIVCLCFFISDLSPYLSSIQAQPSAGIPAAALEVSLAAQLAIPEDLGSVGETTRGTSGKTLIYIQDAHDSLEAQQNIARIIHHLVDKQPVRTVLEEGYEGEVPTGKYFGTIPETDVREQAAYFLMDKLRLGGAEYAHVTRRKDFKLIGADNFKLHLENVRWYREATRHRKKTLWDLEILERHIQRLTDRYFPKGLKEWMRLKTRLDQNELPLLEYLKRVQGVFLKARLSEEFASRYPYIQLLLTSEYTQDPRMIEMVRELKPEDLFKEIYRMEEDFSDQFLMRKRDQKLFHYYRGLQLLRRLNEFTVTPPEYRAARDIIRNLKTEKIAGFIFKYAKESIVLSKRWEKNIRHAVQFYETAFKRDQSVADRLDAFLADENEKVAVLVFGGFHKDTIKEILVEKGIAYAIVTPQISAVSKRHEEYYKRLMVVGHHEYEARIIRAKVSPKADEIPAAVRRANRPIGNLEEATVAGAKGEAQLFALMARLGTGVRELRGKIQNDPDRVLMLRELERLLLNRPEARSEFDDSDTPPQTGSLRRREEDYLPRISLTPDHQIQDREALKTLAAFVREHPIPDEVLLRGHPDNLEALKRSRQPLLKNKRIKTSEILMPVYNPAVDPDIAVFVTRSSYGDRTQSELLVVEVKTGKLVAGAPVGRGRDYIPSSRMAADYTRTYEKGKGYMGRAIALLLLTNSIPSWMSDNVEEREGPVERMYDRLLEDPRFMKTIINQGQHFIITLNDRLEARQPDEESSGEAAGSPKKAAEARSDQDEGSVEDTSSSTEVRSEKDPFNPKSGNTFTYDVQGRLLTVTDDTGKVWQRWEYDDEHYRRTVHLENLKGGPLVTLAIHRFPYSINEGEKSFTNQLEVSLNHVPVPNSGITFREKIKRVGIFGKPHKFYQITAFHPFGDDDETRKRFDLEDQGAAGTILNAIVTQAALENAAVENTATRNLKLLQLYWRFFASKINLEDWLKRKWRPMKRIFFRHGLFGEKLAGELNLIPAVEKGAAPEEPIVIVLTPLLGFSYLNPWEGIYEVKVRSPSNPKVLESGHHVKVKKVKDGVAVFKLLPNGDEKIIGRLGDIGTREFSVRGQPKPVAAKTVGNRIVQYQNNRLAGQAIEAFYTRLITVIMIVSGGISSVLGKWVLNPEFSDVNAIGYLVSLFATSSVWMLILFTAKSLIKIWRGERATWGGWTFSAEEKQEYKKLSWKQKIHFWSVPFMGQMAGPILFVLSMKSVISASAFSTIWTSGFVLSLVFGGLYFWKFRKSEQDAPGPRQWGGMGIVISGIFLVLLEIGLSAGDKKVGGILEGVAAAFSVSGVWTTLAITALYVVQSILQNDFYKYSAKGNRYMRFLLTSSGYLLGVTAFLWIYILAGLGWAPLLPESLGSVVRMAEPLHALPFWKIFVIHPIIPLLSLIFSTRWFTLYYLYKRLPYWKVIFYQALGPFITVIGAFVILGAWPQAGQLIAGLAILAGTWYAVRAPKRERTIPDASAGKSAGEAKESQRPEAREVTPGEFLQLFPQPKTAEQVLQDFQSPAIAGNFHKLYEAYQTQSGGKFQTLEVMGGYAAFAVGLSITEFFDNRLVWAYQATVGTVHSAAPMMGLTIPAFRKAAKKRNIDLKTLPRPSGTLLPFLKQGDETPSQTKERLLQPLRTETEGKIWNLKAFRDNLAAKPDFVNRIFSLAKLIWSLDMLEEFTQEYHARLKTYGGDMKRIAESFGLEQRYEHAIFQKTVEELETLSGRKFEVKQASLLDALPFQNKQELLARLDQPDIAWSMRRLIAAYPQQLRHYKRTGYGHEGLIRDLGIEKEFIAKVKELYGLYSGGRYAIAKVLQQHPARFPGFMRSLGLDLDTAEIPIPDGNLLKVLKPELDHDRAKFEMLRIFEKHDWNLAKIRKILFKNHPLLGYKAIDYLHLIRGLDLGAEFLERADPNQPDFLFHLQSIGAERFHFSRSHSRQIMVTLLGSLKPELFPMQGKGIQPPDNLRASEKAAQQEALISRVRAHVRSIRQVLTTRDDEEGLDYQIRVLDAIRDLLDFLDQNLLPELDEGESAAMVEAMNRFEEMAWGLVARPDDFHAQMSGMLVDVYRAMMSLTPQGEDSWRYESFITGEGDGEPLPLDVVVAFAAHQSVSENEDGDLDQTHRLQAWIEEAMRTSGIQRPVSVTILYSLDRTALSLLADLGGGFDLFWLPADYQDKLDQDSAMLQQLRALAYTERLDVPANAEALPDEQKQRLKNLLVALDAARPEARQEKDEIEDAQVDELIGALGDPETRDKAARKLDNLKLTDSEKQRAVRALGVKGQDERGHIFLLPLRTLIHRIETLKQPDPKMNYRGIVSPESYMSLLIRKPRTIKQHARDLKKKNGKFNGIPNPEAHPFLLVHDTHSIIRHANALKQADPVPHKADSFLGLRNPEANPVLLDRDPDEIKRRARHLKRRDSRFDFEGIPNIESYPHLLVNQPARVKRKAQRLKKQDQAYSSHGIPNVEKFPNLLDGDPERILRLIQGIKKSALLGIASPEEYPMLLSRSLETLEANARAILQLVQEEQFPVSFKRGRGVKVVDPMILLTNPKTVAANFRIFRKHGIDPAIHYAKLNTKTAKLERNIEIAAEAGFRASEAIYVLADNSEKLTLNRDILQDLKIPVTLRRLRMNSHELIDRIESGRIQSPLTPSRARKILRRYETLLQRSEARDEDANRIAIRPVQRVLTDLIMTLMEAEFRRTGVHAVYSVNKAHDHERVTATFRPRNADPGRQYDFEFYDAENKWSLRSYRREGRVASLDLVYVFERSKTEKGIQETVQVQTFEAFGEPVTFESTTSRILRDITADTKTRRPVVIVTDDFINVIHAYAAARLDDASARDFYQRIMADGILMPESKAIRIIRGNPERLPNVTVESIPFVRFSRPEGLYQLQVRGEQTIQTVDVKELTGALTMGLTDYTIPVGSLIPHEDLGTAEVLLPSGEWVELDFNKDQEDIIEDALSLVLVRRPEARDEAADEKPAEDAPLPDMRAIADPFRALMLNMGDDLETLELSPSKVSGMVPQLPLLMDAVLSRNIRARGFGGSVRVLAMATQQPDPEALPTISEMDLAVPISRVGIHRATETLLDTLSDAKADYQERIAAKEARTGQRIDHLSIDFEDEVAIVNLLHRDRVWSISKFWLDYDAERHLYLLRGSKSSAEDLRNKRLRLGGNEFVNLVYIPKLLDQALQYFQFGFSVDEESLKMIEAEIGEERFREKYRQEIQEEKLRLDKYQTVQSEVRAKLADLREQIRRQAGEPAQIPPRLDFEGGTNAEEMLQWAFARPGVADRMRLAALHAQLYDGTMPAPEEGLTYDDEGPHFVTYYGRGSEWVLKSPKQGIPRDAIYQDLADGLANGRSLFVPYFLLPRSELAGQEAELTADIDLDPNSDWVIQRLAFSIKEHVYSLKKKWNAAVRSQDAEARKQVEGDLALIFREWRRLKYRGWAMGFILEDSTFENAALTNSGEARFLGSSFNHSWNQFFKGSTSTADLANTVNLKWLGRLFGEETARRIYGRGLDRGVFDLFWPPHTGHPETSVPIAQDQRAPLWQTGDRMDMEKAAFRQALSHYRAGNTAVSGSAAALDENIFLRRIAKVYQNLQRVFDTFGAGPAVQTVVTRLDLLNISSRGKQITALRQMHPRLIREIAALEKSGPLPEKVPELLQEAEALWKAFPERDRPEARDENALVAIYDDQGRLWSRRDSSGFEWEKYDYREDGMHVTLANLRHPEESVTLIVNPDAHPEVPGMQGFWAYFPEDLTGDRYVYFLEDSNTLEIGDFFPLGTRDSLSQQELQGSGIALTVLNWLVRRADEKGQWMTSSSTRNWRLLSLYDLLFADEIKEEDQYQNLDEIIRTHGFFSGELIGNLVLRTKPDGGSIRNTDLLLTAEDPAAGLYRVAHSAEPSFPESVYVERNGRVFHPKTRKLLGWLDSIVATPEKGGGFQVFGIPRPLEPLRTDSGSPRYFQDGREVTELVGQTRRRANGRPEARNEDERTTEEMMNFQTVFSHPVWRALNQWRDGSLSYDAPRLMELYHHPEYFEAFAATEGQATFLNWLEANRAIGDREGLAKLNSRLDSFMHTRSAIYHDGQLSLFFRYPQLYNSFFKILRRKLRDKIRQKNHEPIRIDLLGPGLLQEPLTLLALIQLAYEAADVTLDEIGLEFHLYDRNGTTAEWFEQDKFIYQMESLREDLGRFSRDLSREQNLMPADQLIKNRALIERNLSQLLEPLPDTKDAPSLVKINQNSPWIQKIRFHSGSYQDAAKNRNVDFVFANEVFLYLDPAAQTEVIQTFRSRLRADGLLLAAGISEANYHARAKTAYFMRLGPSADIYRILTPEEEAGIEKKGPSSLLSRIENLRRQAAGIAAQTSAEAGRPDLQMRNFQETLQNAENMARQGKHQIVSRLGTALSEQVASDSRFLAVRSTLNQLIAEADAAVAAEDGKKARPEARSESDDSDTAETISGSGRPEARSPESQLPDEVPESQDSGREDVVLRKEGEATDPPTFNLEHLARDSQQLKQNGLEVTAIRVLANMPELAAHAWESGGVGIRLEHQDEFDKNYFNVILSGRGVEKGIDFSANLFVRVSADDPLTIDVLGFEGFTLDGVRQGAAHKTFLLLLLEHFKSEGFQHVIFDMTDGKKDGKSAAFFKNFLDLDHHAEGEGKDYWWLTSRRLIITLAAFDFGHAAMRRVSDSPDEATSQRLEARMIEEPVAEKVSVYEGHALTHPNDAAAVAILDDLKVPALVYVSYADLMNTFTPEQRANLFALAEQYHEKVRLTIYEAETTDERLKPFRELQNRHQNVRIMEAPAQEAFERTQTDFVSGFEGFVNIHLSKADFNVKASYNDAARAGIYFFRYQPDETETGLLAAALLWKDYLEADQWLDGIERDADGFLIVTGEYLRALIQRYEANLVVLMSA